VKFAYFGIPHPGGTWTVFTALRSGLKSHGVEVRWLGLGPSARQAYDHPRWTAERADGVVIAPSAREEVDQGKLLVEYLEHSGEFDGVFVNVLANRVQTNAMRYLSLQIRRVMIVHNITPGTYAAAASIRQHVHAAVGVSPRVRSDLVTRFGFDSTRTLAIPNGIDLSSFANVRQLKPVHAPLRLLSLGRLIDIDKGVFWLARILQHLQDIPVQLTIAGDGPDRAELQRRCAPFAGRVRFLGRLAPAQVPAVFADHDVFLFPSRFEGLGLSLVEAMAAGCVPVATHIKGVTDFVIEHGKSGFLFPMGNTRQAADAVRLLAAEPERLCSMAAAARSHNQERFSVPTMAADYARLLDSLRTDPPTISAPLQMGDWHYPKGLRAGLRSQLPTGVKNMLRGFRERLA
jgi:glycosyltransferase involved in cell wall biosynthesis